MKTMPEPTAVLTLSLRDQAENAKYTAAALYLWVHVLNGVQVVFTTAQVVLGGLAGWKVLAREDEFFAAICGLGAALIPALVKALKISEIKAAAQEGAAEYTALRDRFTRCADIGEGRPFAEVTAVAEPLFDRMDLARRTYAPAPEPIFWIARWKVRSGHLDHDHRQVPHTH